MFVIDAAKSTVDVDDEDDEDDDDADDKDEDGGAGGVIIGRMSFSHIVATSWNNSSTFSNMNHIQP